MNNSTYTEEEFFLYTEAAQFLIRETGEAFYVRALGSNYYQIKEYDLVYMDIYKPEYAIKLSAKNIAFEDKKKIVPLYVAFCIQDMFLCRLYDIIPLEFSHFLFFNLRKIVVPIPKERLYCGYSFVAVEQPNSYSRSELQA